ncbi:MAG: pyroglutamyl-peptidase I [Firmicutes bacterium]|nr:pyroglutamyl-peptidase I [Bacillota bacterium]MCL5040067.1 pyroglutamyl-peptidase I [Bacillota bacterium]
MKKVLLTGFEPFGGDDVNPALEASRKLTGWTQGEALVVTRAIPVVFGEAIATLAAAIEEEKPDAVISVGQAGGRAHISLERVAINVNDARMADNAGNRPEDQPIDPKGPVAYWSTLPIKAIVRALQESGIPAAVSNSAGTYVCNHLFYGLMHYLAKEGLSLPAGFIHIPLLPEQAAKKPGQPSMSLDLVVRALQLAIEITLR